MLPLRKKHHYIGRRKPHRITLDQIIEHTPYNGFSSHGVARAGQRRMGLLVFAKGKAAHQLQLSLNSVWFGLARLPQKRGIR